jgi:tryprostatin B 6-hydroxylase
VERITPPEGVTIDGTFIPGGSLVRVPLYSIARGMFDPHIPELYWIPELKWVDERYWEHPTEFLPERWYLPEKYPLTHKYSATAFVPFWTGIPRRFI